MSRNELITENGLDADVEKILENYHFFKSAVDGERDITLSDVERFDPDEFYKSVNIPTHVGYSSATTNSLLGNLEDVGLAYLRRLSAFLSNKKFPLPADIVEPVSEKIKYSRKMIKDRAESVRAGYNRHDIKVY